MVCFYIGLSVQLYRTTAVQLRCLPSEKAKVRHSSLCNPLSSAIAAGIVFKQYIFIGLDPLPCSLWSLIVGGPVIGPMWFIPMIAIFFLAFPLFHRIGSSSLQYLVVMAALAFSLYSARPLDNMNPFLSFVNFSGFYILGVVASSNVTYIREYERTRSVMPVMCGAFLLFIVASAIYLLGDQYESIGFEEGLGTFNNAQFGKLALLVAVFFFFNRFLDKRNLILAWLAEISFGLFSCRVSSCRYSGRSAVGWSSANLWLC